MRYFDVCNPTKTPRVFYDGIEGSQRKITVLPGQVVSGVAIGESTIRMFEEQGDDLILTSTEAEVHEPLPKTNGHSVAASNGKPPLIISGMFGIGDNLHQRAALKELMKTYDVWLETCQVWCYHDLIAAGMKVLLRPTRLWMHAQNILREKDKYVTAKPPVDAHRRKIWYLKPAIDLHGSILAAMNSSFGLPGLADPDFGLPIPKEWRDQAKALMATWDMGGKPLLIHRPIVLRREWDGKMRNPDPVAYNALYESIRQRFFVVSIASLKQGVEWIVGQEQDADVKIHDGSLTLETMAGLFAEADMVFCNAGFAPVLAQAVGTPSIVVYGGRESFKTTQAAGAHLAPTLGIDPVRPCDCHSHSHSCDKKINVPNGIERIDAFIKGQLGELEVYPVKEPKTLIFATTYVDCAERAQLTDQWLKAVTMLNPNCDIMVVDSQSPYQPMMSGLPEFDNYEPRMSTGRMFFTFPDNIGHLSRKGRDGWGRAFSYGLEAAKAGGYEYVVHIEGDSLFRLPVMPIINGMKRDGIKAATVPVNSGGSVLNGWAETGLMFFSVDFLRTSNFVAAYDWRRRGLSPTPEVVIRRLLGGNLKFLPLNGQRGDKNNITHENIRGLRLDWVTHCHNDVWAYDEFMDIILNGQKPDLAKDYDKKFYDMHVPWRPLYDKMGDVLMRHIQFNSVVDFGCGNRYLLNRFEKCGKQVLGIDGSEFAKRACPAVQIMDLTTEIDVGKFDLVVCTEVAEHIEAKYADVLVDNVCRAANHTIFFSAAVAGFGGHHHVNEQERYYWTDKFKVHGFEVDEVATDVIKAELIHLKAIWWFAANSFVMRKT